MQNVGLPQAAVIAYVIGFREEIRNHIAVVPTVAEGNFPHFLVVRPRALNEISRLHRALPEHHGKISFFKPEWARDAKGLLEVADNIGLPTNELILVEIGDLVVKIHAALADTRTVSRGRP